MDYKPLEFEEEIIKNRTIYIYRSEEDTCL